MKLAYVDHFPRQISSMRNFATVVKAIDRKLTKLQVHLFKDDIFRHFLECRSFPLSGVILHNLMLRQMAHGDYREDDQLWFQIGEHLICLSIGEWNLVTVLFYGVDTALTNKKMVNRLLNTYVDGLFHNINLKQIDVLFELDFEVMDNIDALKIALFYFADRVVNGRKCHCQINFSLLNEVDDIDHF